MSKKIMYKIWNESLQFQIDRIEYPTSLSELKEIMETALQQGYRIKPVGEGHGNTQIIDPGAQKSVFISLRRFNSIKSHTEDEITVEGGVTLHELCVHLKAIGKEPYTILEYGFFPLGAICGTHAHDTNSKHDSALFAAHVAGMKILSYRKNTDGNFEVLTKEFHESTHPHEMRLLRSHFGLMGIVYEVTVCIRPATTLAIQFTRQKIDSFLPAAHKAFYQGDDDQCFITLVPDTGDVLIEKRLRVAYKAKSEYNTIKGKIFFHWRLKILFHIEKLASKIAIDALKNSILYVVRKSFLILLPAITKKPLTLHPCDRAVIYDHLPTFDYVEWAYPTHQIRAVLTELMRIQRKHGLYNFFNLYLERKDDDAILSRSYDGDKISIDIVNSGMDDTWFRFVEEWNTASLTFDGIPHFNKTPRLQAIINQFGVKKFYPPQRIRKYEQFRKQLDPDNVFSNKFGESFALDPQ